MLAHTQKLFGGEGVNGDGRRNV